MFRNIAEDIAFVLIKNKIIDIEQRDVYVYGLEVFILNASLIAILLGISLLFGGLLHFIAFLIFFFPLRIFAGGYHAKSSGKCLLLSVILYAVSLAIVQIVPLLYKSVYAMVAGGVFIAIIFFFSPIVNPNNKLEEQQFKRNRMVVRIMLIIDLAVFIPCYVLNFKIASSEIIFVGLVSILLLVGKLSPIRS